MSMKEIDELIVNKLYQQPNTQQNHQEINRQKLLPEQALPTLNVWNDNNHEYDIQELAIFKKLIKQFEDFVNRQNLEKGPIYYVYFILLLLLLAWRICVFDNETNGSVNQ